MGCFENQSGISRRTFLKVGAGTAAVGLHGTARGEDPPPTKTGPLPTRVLGRTGEKVSMLNIGLGRGASVRTLNAAYEVGIRYFDAADCYDNGDSEVGVSKWFQKSGKRDEIFIVTKDHPETPDEWVAMVDTRLEALKTDRIDLFFLHGLGGGFRGGGDHSIRNVPKMKEWGAATEKMKKSGKVRFVGFSSHTEIALRTELLHNAVAGGWVDAIMVASDPNLVAENAEFNKALDACHKAGIGLICMKEMRGVDHAPKVLPEFKEMGLSPHQAILHAVWSDERFASICSDMPNVPIMRANSDAARNFKPMNKKAVGAVIGLYKKYASFCNGCDGRCGKAGGTGAALSDITRALSYHDRDGLRDEGRKLYASLSHDDRNWHDADLRAASEACVCNLDFATLLPRAEQKLA